MKYSALSLDIDANSKPFSDIFPFKVKKTITFADRTTDAIGDDGGALDPFTIFTVTGDVLVLVIGVCKTTLVGAATLEVSVTNATAALLAQIADATGLVAKEFWFDATPSLAEANTPQYHGLSSQDVILTAGAVDITAGVIDFYMFYQPLSADAEVAA